MSGRHVVTSTRATLVRAAFACVVSLGALPACGNGEPIHAPSSSSSATPSREPAPPFVADEGAFGAFHSKRHFVTVRLPEGHAWQIDDRTRPELFARHAATKSELRLFMESGNELVGRAQCEASARKKGLVPEGDVKTLSDRVTVGPDAFDTRIWVALEVGRTGRLRGHVFAFGGNIRTCFFFHASTEVASVADEEVLSQRLALLETRVLDRVDVDPPRIRADAEVPRAPGDTPAKKPGP